jgi:hypothetical protein
MKISMNTSGGVSCYYCAPAPTPPTTTVTAAPCGKTQFLSTATGQCVDQPACTSAQVLYGTSDSAEGHCGEPCRATDGTEYYDVKGRSCEICDKLQCPWGSYRTGSCGAQSTSATATERTTNGYQCLRHPPCKEPEDGEYLDSPDWKTVKGTCKPYPGECAQGQYFALTNSTIPTCKNQPTCTTTQYLKGATADKRGDCEDQPACAQGEHLYGATNTTSGSCGACQGESEYFALAIKRCLACADVACNTDQYRSGTCGGVTNGRCLPQPMCGYKQYLSVTDPGKLEGSCKDCDNAQCGSDQYRDGKCNGACVHRVPAPSCCVGTLATLMANHCKCKWAHSFRVRVRGAPGCQNRLSFMTM